MELEEIKEELKRRLKPLDPESVILFGSFAYGNPNPDSDLDLYVVTKDNFIPKNFQEKMEIHKTVSMLILDIMMRVPVDLIVHTKSMYIKFMNLNSCLSSEIIQKGIILI